MKKLMFSLALMLLGSLSISAQSLEGNWVADASTDEESMAIILSFEGEEPFMQTVYIEAETENVGTMGAAIVTPSIPFVRNGNKLSFNFDLSKIVIAVVKTDWNDKIKAEIDADPSKENMYKSLFQAGMESQKDEIAEILLHGDYEIVSLAEGELVLKDSEGETYTFYQKGD